MSIYYILYIYIILIASLFSKSKYDLLKSNSLINTYVFFFVFLLLALRHWSMGIDLGYLNRYNTGYIQSFETLSKYSWGEILNLKTFLNYEKGYIIFNKLISTIWHNRQFFLGACAFIGILPIALFVNRSSSLPGISWFIFLGLPVFMIHFSGLRQSIALGITTYATKWIENKNPAKFTLAVLFGSTFHSSAIMFLLAYPLYYLKLSNLSKIFSLIAIFVVYFFRRPLFQVFSQIFKENATITDSNSITLFLVFVLIYIFLIFFNNSKNEKNGYINLFWFACICQAFGNIYTTAMRVGYYFMLGLVIALPNTLMNIRQNTMNGEKNFRIYYLLISTAFILFGLYSFANGTWSMTNPYVFFWQK